MRRTPPTPPQSKDIRLEDIPLAIKKLERRIADVQQLLNEQTTCATCS
jgi:hypothetical protein